MKRVFLLILFITAFFLGNAYTKSIVREGTPFITFKKLSVPQKVRQGTLFKLSAQIVTHKNIWENLATFLHFRNPQTGEIIINNDFPTTIPSLHWVPEAIIPLGPVNCFIPYDLPTGTYDLALGFYATKTTPQGTLYIREPYTNPDIKNFAVGTIEVIEAEEAPAEKKEDLILSNFETLADVRKWETRGATIEQDTDNAAEGSSAAKITYLKKTGGAPSVILESFFRYSHPKYKNWSGYDILSFRIYTQKDVPLQYPVILQIKDSSGRRFHWPIPRSTETTEPFTLPLSKIAKAIDTSSVGNFSFFTAHKPYGASWSFYIDDIRLHSLEAEKKKGPFVTFEGLKLSKETVKPGEELGVEASFSISQRFTQNYTLFIHIYRSYDKAGWINADRPPSPSTLQWETDATITQGPFFIFIPPATPPGVYSIQMGLVLARQTPPGAEYIKYYRDKSGVYFIQQPRYPVDYFKLPYVNYEEYGDWVVGTFEVVAP